MKLNKSTLDVLKNFSTINNSIIINSGTRLRTQESNSKQIAFADIEDTFPISFAVYDLGEFLNAMNLIPNAELTFESTYVKVANGSTDLTFQYANMAFVNPAPESVVFPDDDEVVNFSISADNLTQVLKACNTLGLPQVKVSSEVDSTSVIMSAVDPDGETGHTYKIEVGITDADSEFDFFFDTKYMNIIHQDYDVSIHPAGIGRFKAATSEYFIATEAV